MRANPVACRRRDGQGLDSRGASDDGVCPGRKGDGVQKREGKATINDVADLAGVSKKTVSRVINRSPLLNDATREKVEAVIAQLGYVPNPQARALALRRNFLIGLIHDNPNAQTVLTVQQGMLEAIRDTEFAVVVRPINRRSPTLLSDIRHFIEQQRLFGVFILPPISENEELSALCRELGCNYVRMGSARLDDEAHLVESNDRQAVAAAVSHLIAQGHRRIGFVAGPQGFRSAYEREQGYRDALSAHGIATDPALMTGGITPSRRGWRPGACCSPPRQGPARSFPAMTKWPRALSMPRMRQGWRCRGMSRWSGSTIRRLPRICGRR
jgi:hypothetical protein